MQIGCSCYCSLPSGHPDIEAARRAVLAEVKMSGIPIEEEQVEEEEEEPIPGKNNDPPPLYPNHDHTLTLIVP